MRSSRPLLLALSLALGTRDTTAQASNRVDYTLRVDSADLSGITVDMRIHGAPAEFRVAMVAHTEYDDQYWRYLTELRGESSRGAVRVTREDSSLWRMSGSAGDVTLHYRVRFPPSPPMQQAAWKAHLTPSGGLVGGPHSSTTADPRSKLQRKLTRKTLAAHRRGGRRKILLDHLIEAAEGHPVPQEELQRVKARIARALRDISFTR